MAFSLCTCFFLLVFFNEQWIVSTVSIFPTFVIFLLKSEQKIDQGFDIVLICGLYLLVSFGILAYQLEKRTKLSFLG